LGQPRGSESQESCVFPHFVSPRTADTSTIADNSSCKYIYIYMFFSTLIFQVKITPNSTTPLLFPPLILLYIYTRTIYIVCPYIHAEMFSWIEHEYRSLLQKSPYKRCDILQKRPMILRSLVIVATPYPYIHAEMFSWIEHVYIYIRLYMYIYTYIIYVCCKYMNMYIYIYVCICIYMPILYIYIVNIYSCM